MKEIPMDLKQLRYFIHVAEFGSFTKAADFLDIAQPVLSRQIRKLEVNLGRNLLIRTGRGVTLTDTGQVLLDHSRGILHQIERAFEDVTRGQLSGQISLGIPPTIAKILAVPITKRFHKLLPDASLIITEGLTALIEDRIQTGGLDMGLVHNPSFSPDLENTLLAKEALHLIAPTTDKINTKRQGISLTDVSKLPLILPSHPNTYRMLVEIEMAKIPCKPRVVLEMNSVDTILELVAEGMGYAILSKDTTKLVHPNGRLKAYPIYNPYLINRLFLSISNKRIATKTQKTMSSIIRNICNDHFQIQE